MALANPVYLALADDRAIRNIIANGVRGTAMPAFAESAGGLLTNKQIDVITQQIRARWLAFDHNGYVAHEPAESRGD